MNLPIRILACGLAAGLLLGRPVAAQTDSTRISLPEAVEAAWRKATQSAEVAGQSRRARAEQTAAGAFWAAPPALELSHRDDRLQSNTGARETEVGVAVPLWLPGQRAARTEAAAAEAAAAVAAETAGRLRVAGLVRDAAWEVSFRQTELQQTEAHATALDVLAKDVDRRVAAGELARSDALAASAERLASSALASQARQRLRVARSNWTALTGLSLLPALPTDLGKSIDGRVIASDDHPAMRLAASTVELARRRLDAVKASNRSSPEFITRLRQDVSGRGDPTSNSIGFAIRVPFGTADRNEPLLAAALTELEVAQAAEREQRDRLQGDLETARGAAEAAAQELADEEVRARLLRERAALIQTSFRAGETSLPDTLRALTAASQAEASLARQQAALGLAQARLQQALGLLP